MNPYGDALDHAGPWPVPPTRRLSGGFHPAPPSDGKKDVPDDDMEWIGVVIGCLAGLADDLAIETGVQVPDISPVQRLAVAESYVATIEATGIRPNGLEWPVFAFEWPADGVAA